MSNDVVVLYELNPSFDLIETGPGPGPPGATGLPGLVWKGAWNSGTAYIVGDAVSLSGSSYICISAHTNHTPPNATYWNVLAAVGTNGTNGVPGLVWQGAWSGATAYAVGDAVSLSGSSYICISAHTNHTPPNATYWNVLAAVGATGATGGVGMNWTGAWNSGTAYAVNDGVSLSGSSYICISAHTNHTPPNATYWSVLAAVGAAGTDAAADLGCRAYNNANISIPDSTATDLTFNSERWDSSSFHGLGSNTERITNNSGASHIYVIGANVEFAASAVGIRRLEIYLNGSTLLASVSTPGVSTESVKIAVTTSWYLDNTDYVTARVYQTSGGSLNILATSNGSPEFWIVRC